MEKKQNVPELRFQGFSGEWEQQKFGKVATFINGRAYAQCELLSAGKYKVLRVGNFYTNSTWYYSNLELSDKYYANHGDLLYTWSATFGPHIWDGDKVIYHYHIWKIMVKEQLEKLFFLQLLERDKKNLLNDTNGSTMVHITKSGMENKTDFIPHSIDEQSKIGQFCRRINYKIEKEKHKIQKLQQFRQAMLIRLFPREGAAEPELRFRGFSGKWKACTLSSFGRATGGISLESGFTKRGKYKVVNIGSYSEQSTYIDQGLRADKTKRTADRILNKNDLVMILNDKTSKGNIIGRVLLIDADDTYVYNQRNERIEVNCARFVPQFLYELLNAEQIRMKIIKAAQGNTQIYVNWSVIRKLSYMVPPSLDEQKQIAKFLKTVDDFISLQQKKLERMQRLKAALLEKMFV